MSPQKRLCAAAAVLSTVLALFSADRAWADFVDLPGEAGAPAPERALEDRLEGLLNARFGPESSRVFIRLRRLHAVEPEQGEETAPGVPQGRPSALWDDMVRRIEESAPVLPGYRLPGSLKEEALRRAAGRIVRQRAPAGPAEPRVARMVTIFLDSSLREDQASQARAMATQALGLNIYRGDELKVARMRLRKGWSGLFGGARSREKLLLSIAQGGGAALVLILALAAWRMSGPFGPGEREDEPPEKPRPAGAPGARPSAQAKLPDIACMNHLLRSEPPESVAWVLRYMDLTTGAALFRRLSPERKREVAAHLLGPATPGQRRRALAGLRSRLVAHGTGEGLLSELLLRASDRTREDVLSHLSKKHPQTSHRIRTGLLTMEDLSTADASSLRTLLSAFSCDELALGFYELPDGARARFLEALPAVIGGMVRDKAETLVPGTYEQVEGVRADIYARWRRLETSGRVRPLQPQGALP